MLWTLWLLCPAAPVLILPLAADLDNIWEVYLDFLHLWAAFL
jgi:hypothetical protein